MLRGSTAGLLLAAALVTACSSTTPAPAGTSAPSAVPSAGGIAPAAHDIPDTQVYLTYQGPNFTIEYPEGWTQTVTPSGPPGTGTGLGLDTWGPVFTDKDNRIAVQVVAAPAPDTAALQATVQGIPGATVTAPAHSFPDLNGAIVATYQAQGSPDPVTGKAPMLATNRYIVPGTGMYAMLEFSTPVGVDNFDAYKRMVSSFRWK